MIPAIVAIKRSTPSAGATLRAAITALILLATIALPAYADDAPKLFDIKAQPLAEALMAFGAQSGAIVLASSVLTSGKVSNPVSGHLSPAEALSRILRGTGLRPASNADGSFVIEREPPPGRQPAPRSKSKANEAI